MASILVSANMLKRSPLYQQHVKVGAKLVDFSGWEMPLHYGSQLEEHHIVRNAAGVFDVSHMTVVDVAGADAEKYLRYLLANDVARLQKQGKALYSAMLNEAGGILDDLIVYKRADAYRLVVNCGTREKDLRWMQEKAKGFALEIKERADVGILAVQGPQAESCLLTLFSEVDQKAIQALEVFQACDTAFAYVARTGYTGEAGFELIVENHLLDSLWEKLLQEGVKPIGLGARDTLRLEAGMNLYGSDMDESINPYEAGMDWTVSWHDAQRDFIGRSALETLKDKHERVLVGLLFRDRGVLRAHQPVLLAEGQGEITSGTFSPTLNFSIALARIPLTRQQTAEVEMRKKRVEVEIVKPPFVRHGKAVYKNYSF